MKLIPSALLLASLFSVKPAFAFQSIFIVRHAEKKDSSKDPELSSAGAARANRLAQALQGSDISAIFTSEYKRTQQTAAPLAAALKIKPTASNDVAKIVKILKDDTSSKNALVVGHGNTIPEIVKAFGNEQKIDIQESDYDRLYILTPQKDGKAVLNMVRY